MEDEVVIGGLPVPPQLIALIRAGRWAPPGDDILRDIFGEDPEQPCFYGERMLIGENRIWHAEPENAGPSRPITEENLGILVEMSLVIADLGPSMPIVLDYRESLTFPRVLYPRGLTWVQIAESFEQLTGLLRLQESV
ncbi:hypothetical protein AB0I69_36345 [Streptomyces sp. NPDC050508]|uniref:hypothetical protein n=1 Tax=Streptomyces sp. NPDC050508 TaxID=3155405 RepID=UPI00341FD34D